MAKRSFFYNNSLIYKIGLKLLHGKAFEKRYKYISKIIGSNKSVLEPACGPAILPDFLKKNTTYFGFDINEKFIKYAKKKGLNVKIGDATNSKSYKKSDVVILCDALHHMGLELEAKTLKLSYAASKKMFIICDPFKVEYVSFLPRWIPGLNKLIKLIYEYIEKDGNNKVKMEHIKSKSELRKEMINGFGIIPKDVKRKFTTIGVHHIVTYFLEKK